MRWRRQREREVAIFHIQSRVATSLEEGLRWLTCNLLLPLNSAGRDSGRAQEGRPIAYSQPPDPQLQTATGLFGPGTAGPISSRLTNGAFVATSSKA